MVVRKRARKILIPLALYSVSGLLVGYFVHHAHNGTRGLDAKRQLKIQAHELFKELEAVKIERADWERRIALLRSDQIDRDLLEERARALLGRVHRNDLVIITGPARP
jgi:cell division protein FtsB